jgi:alanyl-tRNA synthetase
MLSQTIRKNFQNYFQAHGHQIVSSSSVVPHDDPSLLFSNAGMNQFKDVFTGSGSRFYQRAVTVQKCIRAGGKHNDLENVGHTSRHLTFFEMLGNFSFGNYFKSQAIQFAWQVSTEIFGLEAERIWPTVFESDEEAYEIWQQYVPIERITRLGAKDNFWSMGETGPCGPCSELLYDRGESFGFARSPLEDQSGERFLEFWNLVFMQFNKLTDGRQIVLPTPSIDTGAGLERIVSLKMGVESVFETDLFLHLIHQIEKVSHKQYDPNTPHSASFRVIADHLRSLSFAIADGAQPSNVDRGYVLRKILRRSVRYGKKIGFEQPFLAKILPSLIECMGSDYPELVAQQGRIAEILTLEEENFWRTLRRGGKLLNDVCKIAKDEKRPISGHEAFSLKDTYGLPLEEILLLAHDENLSVDAERFAQLEHEARELSRLNQKKNQLKVQVGQFEDLLSHSVYCQFTGYEAANLVNTSTSTIIGLYLDHQPVDQLSEGQEGLIVLDKTPFYAEKGGQVSDSGLIESNEGQFEVWEVQSPEANLIIHQGKVTSGIIKLSHQATAKIDTMRRQSIARSHSATHLLNWALTHVLGDHVQQKGSLVDSDSLRFDFTHHKAITWEELKEIEQLINSKILLSLPVKSYEKSYLEVQQDRTIKQFFADKYGALVRIVDIDFSKELCGGTHVENTASIGSLRILKESSVAAGVRRIEAVCGYKSLNRIGNDQALLRYLSSYLKCNEEQLSDKISQLTYELNLLTKKLVEFKKNELTQIALHLKSGSESLKKTSLITAKNPVETNQLNGLMEELTSYEGVCAIACHQDNRVQLAIRIGTQARAIGLNANLLIQELSSLIEGKGGGKAELAQAGGKDSSKIDLLFETLRAKLL